MNTLYFECQMGAAGDMIAAALLELQEDPIASIEKLNSLGLESVRYVARPMMSHGICGMHLDVLVDGESEHVEDIHDDTHVHPHCHHHHPDDEAEEAHAHCHCHHHHHPDEPEETHAHCHCHHHHHSDEAEEAHTHCHCHHHHHDDDLEEAHTHCHCHHHHHSDDLEEAHTHCHCHHHHHPDEPEEAHAHCHCHHHHHDHEHHHAHRGMHEIEAIVEGLSVSDKIKRDILGIYQLIARAESKAHNRPVEEIHFHEVGAMDAIADITAACVLLDDLHVDKIISSPINVGSGWVRCAHGILPVPAPATSHILAGVPIYRSMIPGELCTPTGAAILRYFAAEFEHAAIMSYEKVGYGLGTKEFDRLNCIRAYLGQCIVKQNSTACLDLRQEASQLVQLECNLDDMTPEYIGYAMEQLFKAGALDVWTQSIGMKKNRPGTMLCCLCTLEKREDMIRAIFAHTTTLGIREIEIRRHELDRQIIHKETAFGEIHIKKSSGYGIEREKPEFEDIVRAAEASGGSALDIWKKLMT